MLMLRRGLFNATDNKVWLCVGVVSTSLSTKTHTHTRTHTQERRVAAASVAHLANARNDTETLSLALVMHQLVRFVFGVVQSKKKLYRRRICLSQVRVVQAHRLSTIARRRYLRALPPARCNTDSNCVCVFRELIDVCLIQVD